jgi:hypothetical protein
MRPSFSCSGAPKRYDISATKITRTPITTPASNATQTINLATITSLTAAIHSGTGNDTFALKGSLPGIALTLDGGGGVNTLDYSAYVGDVVANLLLGTATGVTGGVSKIQNVTGSIGNNLLVGDASANVLIGGTGRNILIGEGGVDRLIGGGGDNLLIGGSTRYDRNAAALTLVLQEWLQNSSFSTRKNALIQGTDLLAGKGIKLDATGLLPDGLANVLTPGPADNWLIS